MGKQMTGLLLWVHALYVLLVLSKGYPLLRLLTSDIPRPPTPPTPPRCTTPPTPCPRRPPKYTTTATHRPESEGETETCPSVQWTDVVEENTWTLETEHARLILKATTKSGTVVEVILHL
uniref:E4 n=1 Tax=Human papillomavirus 7 TaxID=10620 RepID=A0A5B9GJI7_HPV07|nr:E4 [Human papillomavirus type 7]QEE83800.1 E4 [Human papillomavirus type 7]QEE83805.1 E4 [Human papillomavirus type 7]QEE83812.1 E4 [Human papillomavirus type 7]